VARALEAVPPELEDVAPIGDLEHPGGILLDEHDCEAASRQLDDLVEHPVLLRRVKALARTGTPRGPRGSELARHDRDHIGLSGRTLVGWRRYAAWMRSSSTSTRLTPLKLKSSSTR
jgi:hypothetical protein